MRRICVFTGSNPGVRSEYRQAARVLAEELVERGLGLVYGGASVGLMGVIADTALARGGEVIGVIPRALLGLHNKPIGLLNVEGYFDPFLALVAHASKEGFIPSSHESILMLEEKPALLLDRFATYSPQARIPRWTELPPER